MFNQLELFDERPATAFFPMPFLGKAETLTLSEFFSCYIDSIRFRFKSFRRKEGHLKYFESFFGNCRVTQLSKAGILAYADHEQKRGKKLSTITLEVLVLSSVYTHMRKNFGTTFENPVKDFPYVFSENRVRYLEREEASQLLQCAKQTKNPMLADFIELALYTGCRKTELLRLRFLNIDWKRKILTVEGHTAKTGKTRYIPINRAAHAVLERRRLFRDRHCPESPVVFCKKTGEGYTSLSGSFERALRAAGIENFRIHDLRHTFASWLVTEGVELTKIRDLLGHSTIKMTERYAHLAPNRLHEAVKVLDAYLMG